MAWTQSLSGLGHRLMAIGSYPDEPSPQRAKRRIILIAIWLTVPGTVILILVDLGAGLTWVAVGNTLTLAGAIAAVAALHWRPKRFALIVHALFAAVYVPQVIETTLLGGLVPSSFAVLYGLVLVLGALVALDIKAAGWWFGAFVISVIYAAVIPQFVTPLYEVDSSLAETAFTITAVASLTFIVMAYFVRQRDEAQRQSDELLHNILPEAIADRLKDSNQMIAESFDHASVLFADVVDFTPMSSTMPAPALVGLLNSLFTVFDGLVDDLGLEKIKTVGDEYMVAAGVPIPRADHASAIAELALRLRESVRRRDVDGRAVELRIGINSGPVVAGIIGTQKFAYDLWGDTVNTASRMQTSGVPGTIQVTDTTFTLIESEFVCELRGLVPVKGKGEMRTYFLVSRRDDPAGGRT